MTDKSKIQGSDVDTLLRELGADVRADAERMSSDGKKERIIAHALEEYSKAKAGGATERVAGGGFRVPRFASLATGTLAAGLLLVYAFTFVSRQSPNVAPSLQDYAEQKPATFTENESEYAFADFSQDLNDELFDGLSDGLFFSSDELNALDELDDSSETDEEVYLEQYAYEDISFAFSESDIDELEEYYEEDDFRQLG